MLEFQQEKYIPPALYHWLPLPATMSCFICVIMVVSDAPSLRGQLPEPRQLMPSAETLAMRVATTEKETIVTMSLMMVMKCVMRMRWVMMRRMITSKDLVAI